MISRTARGARFLKVIPWRRLWRLIVYSRATMSCRGFFSRTSPLAMSGGASTDGDVSGSDVGGAEGRDSGGWIGVGRARASLPRSASSLLLCHAPRPLRFREQTPPRACKSSTKTKSVERPRGPRKDVAEREQSLPRHTARRNRSTSMGTDDQWTPRHACSQQRAQTPVPKRVNTQGFLAAQSVSPKAPVPFFATTLLRPLVVHGLSREGFARAHLSVCRLSQPVRARQPVLWGLGQRRLVL